MDSRIWQLDAMSWVSECSGDWLHLMVSSRLEYLRGMVPHKENRISVRAEWLLQSWRTPSEESETPRWQNTACLALVSHIGLHNALGAWFHLFFSLGQSSISYEHSAVVANCDQMSEWVHWVHYCIGIAMRWVTLGTSLLRSLLPARKIQFSYHWFSTSFQVARYMWQFKIYCWFLPFALLLLVAISGITSAHATMFPMLQTWNATAASAVPTYTKFETGYKLPEFSCIVVSCRSNQFLTRAQSFFKSLILNRCCSCNGRCPFSGRQYLPRCWFSNTPSFRHSLLRQLWLPQYRHIWVMRSPSTPSTRIFIQG